MTVNQDSVQDAVREFVADAIDYYLGAASGSEYVDDIEGASALTDDEWDEAFDLFVELARKAKVVFE